MAPGSDPDYPLGSRSADRVATPGGIPLRELDLYAPGVTTGELRATPETLRLQAEVALAAGRPELAANLLRAAELAPLADETVLELYAALRPRRSSSDELAAWADRLEEWGAPLTAGFVREAAEVYARRGLLAA